MAGSYISFTDGSGAAQLDNGLTSVGGGVGSRFANWAPDARVIGPRKSALGTGAQYVFRFRTDYVASFSLENIPVANLATAIRLIEWLRRGNTCSVTTGDSAGNVYATCALAEGTEPSLQQTDRVDQRWTLQLTLVNVAASPAAMICTYT